MKILPIGHLVKANPIQTQSPKSQNEYKLIYNKGLQKKKMISQSEQNKPNQTLSCLPSVALAKGGAH